MTKLSAHFSSHEFTCHHCGKLPNGYPSQALLTYLEKLRAHFDTPVTVMSGYRCPKHNKAVGGATHSQHLQGTAADIILKDVSPRDVWAWANENNVDGGVGRYASFTHVDKRGFKARW
jgi:uncharacterized protein YcbK (DUF882 family)